MSKPTARRASPGCLEIEVARATAEDVAAVRDLLIQHFGYIYIILLGHSKERASGLLEAILKANKGQHPLGYKSFYVARPKGGRGETAGILRLKTKSPGEVFGTLVSVTAVLKILLQNLGPRGTFHALRTWWDIRGITPDVGADELHIVYLAVADSALERQVGKQLLQYAKAVAINEGKKFISLYVRAKNANARSFFLSQGFSAAETVTDPAAENLLKQGPSVRMTAAVPAPAQSV